MGERLARVWRFYGTAALNTGFGYGSFALLVAAGCDRFIAQALAHCMGMAFNFVSYRRLVFADRRASLPAYLLSYGVNYLVGVVLLVALSGVTASPYLAGALALLATSLVNLLLLDRLVFRRARQGSA